MPTSTAPATSTTATKPRSQIKVPPQPKTYSPTGEIGGRVANAFAIKLEMDRLKAQLDGHVAALKAHAVKNNISRIDVGEFQVQIKSRNKWEYSVALQAKMLKIEQEQKLEQLNKKARNTPTIYAALAVSSKAASQG
jgi:hypothetical protein